MQTVRAVTAARKVRARGPGHIDIPFVIVAGAHGSRDADHPPDRVEARVRRGEIWQVGRHRLVCADALDEQAALALRPGGGTWDTVVFDPPYDAETPVLALRPRCRDALVFTDHRHLMDCANGWPRFRCQFVWDCCSCWHTPRWPLARFKSCLWHGRHRYDPDGWRIPGPAADGVRRKATNARGTYEYTRNPEGVQLATLFRSPISAEFAGNAHAKPVAWMTALIANCTGGDIYDPFVGGGTTLIAAELLGRTCFAAEMSPAMCDVAISRFVALFGGAAKRL